MDEFEERVKAVGNAVPWPLWKKVGAGGLVLGGAALAAYLAKRWLG